VCEFKTTRAGVLRSQPGQSYCSKWTFKHTAQRPRLLLYRTPINSTDWMTYVA